MTLIACIAPPLARLLIAIAPRPRAFDLTAYLDACARADIDPYECAMRDFAYTRPTTLLELDATRHLFALFANDDTESPYMPELTEPYDIAYPYYYSDSAIDDMTEILDFDQISDNDPDALMRRCEYALFDLLESDIAPDRAIMPYIAP